MDGITVPAAFTDEFLTECRSNISAVAVADENQEVDAANPECFTSFRAFIEEDDDTDLAVTVEDDEVVELRATVAGQWFVEAVEEVEAVEATDDTEAIEAEDAVPGMDGLRDNPLSRVDFYATVVTGDAGTDDQPNDDPIVLHFVASAPALAGVLTDYDSGDDDTNDARRFTYSADLTAAAFRAAVGIDEDDDDNYVGVIVAFAVKDNKGLALQSQRATQVLTVEH